MPKLDREHNAVLNQPIWWNPQSDDFLVLTTGVMYTFSISKGVHDLPIIHGRVRTPEIPSGMGIPNAEELYGFLHRFYGSGRSEPDEDE